VKASRTASLTALLMIGALTLTACGDPDAGSTAGNADIDCASGDIKGAGSTFQKNMVQQWIKDYTAACDGATVDYQGIGSGAGIKQFGSATTDFAGSDSVMKDQERADADRTCGSPAVHLPVTAGAIAIAYNLPDVEDLRLSPGTIAGIFTGRIKAWDDAAIKADNPSASLPETAITAVHREDSSGSTDVFSKFLGKTAGTAWTLGTGKELDWPGSIQGAKGSDGVTQAAAATEGGVTYAEVSYVDSGGLRSAKVRNGAGGSPRRSPGRPCRPPGTTSS
jgi:phosphate transport system substrate-binding protein